MLTHTWVVLALIILPKERHDTGARLLSKTNTTFAFVSSASVSSRLEKSSERGVDGQELLGEMVDIDDDDEVLRNFKSSSMWASFSSQ